MPPVVANEVQLFYQLGLRPDEGDSLLDLGDRSEEDPQVDRLGESEERILDGWYQGEEGVKRSEMKREQRRDVAPRHDSSMKVRL